MWIYPLLIFHANSHIDLFLFQIIFFNSDSKLVVNRKVCKIVTDNMQMVRYWLLYRQKSFPYCLDKCDNRFTAGMRNGVRSKFNDKNLGKYCDIFLSLFLGSEYRTIKNVETYLRFCYNISFDALHVISDSELLFRTNCKKYVFFSLNFSVRWFCVTGRSFR